MSDYGMRVKLQFSADGAFGNEVEVLRNVTEVHYGYASIFDENRVAIESDIHQTGNTYALNDIAEFEVFPEIEPAESFYGGR